MIFGRALGAYTDKGALVNGASAGSGVGLVVLVVVVVVWSSFRPPETCIPRDPRAEATLLSLFYYNPVSVLNTVFI